MSKQEHRLKWDEFNYLAFPTNFERYGSDLPDQKSYFPESVVFGAITRFRGEERLIRSIYLPDPETTDTPDYVFDASSQGIESPLIDGSVFASLRYKNQLNRNQLVGITYTHILRGSVANLAYIQRILAGKIVQEDVGVNSGLGKRELLLRFTAAGLAVGESCSIQDIESSSKVRKFG